MVSNRVLEDTVTITVHLRQISSKGRQLRLKLFEYEGKEIAQMFGLPTPRGAVVDNVDAALKSLGSLSFPVVLKAQILAGGRKKAGGVLFASSKDQAETLVKKLIGSKIQDEPVSRIIIEEKMPADRELYTGISISRERRCYLLLISRNGGVDIEELAERDPGSIVRKEIDPLTGLGQTKAEEIVRTLGYSVDQLRKLSNLLVRLYEIARTYDAELVEVNPLIETPTGQFILADFKMIVDDNSLFRHPDLSKRLQERGTEFTDRELEAQKYGLSYVDLSGNIGVLGNGAGLVMATLDLIAQFNGAPANFCDLGGGADEERVKNALRILLGNEKVKVVLVNILAAFTKCHEVARGIVDARNRFGANRPIVVRMIGLFEDEGKKILREASIPYYDTMEDATREAARLAMEAAADCLSS